MLCTRELFGHSQGGWSSVIYLPKRNTGPQCNTAQYCSLCLLLQVKQGKEQSQKNKEWDGVVKKAIKSRAWSKMAVIAMRSIDRTYADDRTQFRDV